MIVFRVIALGLAALALGATKNAQQVAEAQQLEASKAVLETIALTERIVGYKPEFVEMQHHWTRRVVDLQLRAIKRERNRIKTAEGHLDAMRAKKAELMRRVSDGGEWLLASADAYIADAEVLVAEVSAEQPDAKAVQPTTSQPTEVVVEK